MSFFLLIHPSTSTNQCHFPLYPVNRFWLCSRRAAYSSVYDKNADDQIHSEPVPDDVIQATQSTKYWAPNPHTGVFGPPGEHASGFHSASSTTNASAAAGSVLEEKAWFRPTSIEDLEKPHPNP
ncbi:hydrogen peroxide induced protein, putative [Medicago truncatula]|uniref:Hydrogen peroxide induced protein, putative n=1 Tax=Medicago truncatula TaxID=3880 RepID=A0A072UCR9_MEDTR|nr:hydrogen peroxide induced protein, putative [Medicago truncatula]